MKYLVHNEKAGLREQPCEEAFRWLYAYEFYISASAHPEEIMEFYERGRNHRREGDKHYRTEKRSVWVVEFNTLEELMSFIAKYGGAAIDPPNKYNPDIASITLSPDIL